MAYLISALMWHTLPRGDHFDENKITGDGDKSEIKTFADRVLAIAIG